MQRVPQNISTKQYITLPRMSPAQQKNSIKINGQRPQLKVVIPSSIRQNGQSSKNQNGRKSQNNSSKINPPNSPGRVCEDILQKLSKKDLEDANIQEYVDLMIRTTISKKLRAKARLNRTPTPQYSTSPDNYEKWGNLHHSEILSKCCEFESVIERQREEIEDLRSRLVERKKLEEVWKETLKTLFTSVREKILEDRTERDNLKEKLNVTAAKLRIIEVSKAENGENLHMLLPTGQFSQSLMQLAGRISASKTTNIFPPNFKQEPKIIKVENEEYDSYSEIKASPVNSPTGGKREIIKAIVHTKINFKPSQSTCRNMQTNENDVRLGSKRSIQQFHEMSENPTKKKRKSSECINLNGYPLNPSSPDSGWNSSEYSDSISSPGQSQQSPVHESNVSNWSHLMPSTYENSSSNQTYSPVQHNVQSSNEKYPNLLKAYFGENIENNHSQTQSKKNKNIDSFIGDIFDDIADMASSNTTDISFLHPSFAHSAPWEDIDLKDPFL